MKDAVFVSFFHETLKNLRSLKFSQLWTMFREANILLLLKTKHK